MTAYIVAFCLLVIPTASFAQAGLRVFTAVSSSNTVIPFVTNSDGTLSSSAAIPVGSFPHYVAVSADGLFAYVSNRDSNNLSVISSDSLSVVQTVATSDDPYGVAVTPDGSKVLVANRLPPAGCIGPTCSPLVQVFNRNATTGQLTLSDSIGTINGAQLRDITVLRDGVNAYVVDQSNNRVIVVSLLTNSVLTSIGVGNQPLGIASNPEGTRVYVANFTSASISVINTSSRTVIATPASGTGGTFEVDTTPDGRFFYAANASGQTVSQFDAQTNTAVAAPLATGQDPDGLTVSPDGANLYVTNASNSDQVSFYRINSSSGVLTANGTIAAGNNPVAISMKHRVILPPTTITEPGSNTPAPGPGKPSQPTWVAVQRHNLALKIDFAAPTIGFNEADLRFRVYVVTKDHYPVASINGASSGVIVPYVKNEDGYWVTVTAINGFGEGPPAEWVYSPAPDWAFYPKDADGRPCPTPLQCR